MSGLLPDSGTVSRTSDKAATVKFTSNEAGQYYYQAVNDNAGVTEMRHGRRHRRGGGGGCNAGAAGLLAVSGVARAIMKRAGKKSKK